MFSKIQRKKRLKLVQGKPNIKVGSVWFKTLILGLIIFTVAIVLSYKIFDGSNTFHYILKINEQKNEIDNLQDELDSLKLQIQLNDVSLNKKDQELGKLKEENNDLQEEILFYEKIVGKRR